MCNVRTYIGRDVTSGEVVEVDATDGLISSVRRSLLADNGCWLSPGLIDLQVNGYSGIDFNDASCDVAAISLLADVLASAGTTTFLPTIITASHETLVRRLRTIAVARSQSTRLQYAIPCIHLEGPWISPLDGYRGAHPLADVRVPSLVEFEQLQEAADGLIRLVTLSPHWENSPEFIRALCEVGIIVSVGHTHASPEMIQTAVDAGARLSTHLGNGIAAKLERHPNPLWTQLAEGRLTPTFIADGVHLPYDVLRVMLRVKGVEHAVLVSDSVGLAGSPAGQYTSDIGGDVLVGSDGSIRMSDGLLAGSGIALKDAVARVANIQGFSLADAVRMATINPAQILKSEREKGIIIGAPADLLLFRWQPGDTTLQITESIYAGHSVA